MTNEALNNKSQNPVWQYAQEEELKCWIGMKKKLETHAYLKIKSQYWLDFLEKLGITAEDLRNQSVLEIGNGPSGLFLLAKENKQFFLCDPLNAKYKENFPWLFGCNVMISSRAECLNLGQKFQSIFAINSIDHCDNINEFLVAVSKHLDPNGKFYLGVNTHNYKLIQLIWERFQAYIEPHHPYQMTTGQYGELFSRYFDVKEIIDMEDLVIAVNQKTDLKSLGLSERRRTTNFREKIFDREIFGKILVRALKRLGYPQHDFHRQGKSLFRNKLFVLSPKVD